SSRRRSDRGTGYAIGDNPDMRVARTYSVKTPERPIGRAVADRRACAVHQANACLELDPVAAAGPKHHLAASGRRVPDTATSARSPAATVADGTNVVSDYVHVALPRPHCDGFNNRPRWSTSRQPARPVMMIIVRLTCVIGNPRSGRDRRPRRSAFSREQ